MNKGVRFFAAAVVSFVVYLLLAGSLQTAELLMAGIVAILSAALMSGFGPVNGKIFNPIRLLKALVYLPFFLWKMILANLHIASVVINPRLPIAPSILKFKSNLKSPEGILLLTSSITLTPGTLSVDEKDGSIYVHAVTPPAGPVLEPFEKRLKGVTE